MKKLHSNLVILNYFCTVFFSTWKFLISFTFTSYCIPKGSVDNCTAKAGRQKCVLRQKFLNVVTQLNKISFPVATSSRVEDLYLFINHGRFKFFIFLELLLLAQRDIGDLRSFFSSELHNKIIFGEKKKI